VDLVFRARTTAAPHILVWEVSSTVGVVWACVAFLTEPAMTRDPPSATSLTPVCRSWRTRRTSHRRAMRSGGAPRRNTVWRDENM